MPRHPHRPPLHEVFAQRFGRPCATIARAPGRVNLIGEHTDYNDGFVLPMALEQSTWVAAAPRTDDIVHACSVELAADASWPLRGSSAAPAPPWASYIAGVLALLGQRGVHPCGCDLLIQSDVPVGGGLSSSAALEVATALALTKLTHASLSAVALADLCRRAEHDFAHVPCGIMDQYVSVLAKAGCAFLLDCRSRTWEHIPLPLNEHAVLVVNSGVRHDLAASEYAVRQEQCRQALAFLRRANPALRALRDVSSAEVEARAIDMQPEIASRARHVTSENDRVLAAAAALRRQDLAEVGRLMSASHVSLRSDYEVSCPELDRLVELVETIPGVLGARMTGGGFGGCIVAIAQRECLVRVEAALRDGYDGWGHGPARMLVSTPGPGASVEFP